MRGVLEYRGHREPSRGAKVVVILNTSLEIIVVVVLRTKPWVGFVQRFGLQIEAQMGPETSQSGSQFYVRSRR